MQFSSDASETGHDLQRAMRSFCVWNVSSMDEIGAVTKADPDFAMAHAVRGLALTGGRHVRFMPAMQKFLNAAKAGKTPQYDHEKAYIQALEHWVDNDPDRGIAVCKEILADNPTDIFMHRLGQQELFNFGRTKEMLELVETAAPSWSSDMEDYSTFLAIRCFSNEECLRFDIAEDYGREAIELDPSDPWAAHGVAHVLVMQGRIDEGVAWLEGLSGNWEGKNQLVHHNWWHLCLFLLEQGEHERILEIFDQWIYNLGSPLIQAMPDNVIDVTNAAALLMRLELRGVDVGERWSRVEQPAEERIDNHAHPFTSAHAAMILAACGNFDKANELIDSMAEYAAQDQGVHGRVTAKAALPAARAAIAHRKGDHEAVLAAMLPACSDIVHMGGSHAQRDVFFQVLVDSCKRLGRAKELANLRTMVSNIGFADIDQRTLYREAFN